MLKIVENLWAVETAPNPAGELSAPPDHVAGVEGLLPLPKNPTPALGLRPFGLGPNETSWSRPCIGLFSVL